MAPHIDDTAIALLALRDRGRGPGCANAVQYLEVNAPTLAAPWSLAWASLALAAHRRPIARLAGSLSGLSDLSRTADTGTLAIASLALDHTRGLSAFGVSSMSVTRRELIIGSASLAAGSVVTTPFFLPKFHSDHRLKRSRVAVLNAHQYSQDLDQMLAAALRLFPINVRGKTVVLKPNLVDFIPGNAINTHPLLVLAAAESFRSMGAKICCCSRRARTSTRHAISAFTNWL